MDIVYRINGAEVVFAERHRALYVAHIWRALNESKTWGELRRNLPNGEWEEHFRFYFDEREEPVPGDDELFDSEDAPGRADGDYPAWLEQEALEWFPPELIAKHGGDAGPSVLNGDYLELPSDKAEQIAEDLRALGHAVERIDLEF